MAGISNERIGHVLKVFRQQNSRFYALIEVQNQDAAQILGVRFRKDFLEAVTAAAEKEHVFRLDQNQSYGSNIQLSKKYKGQRYPLSWVLLSEPKIAA